MKLRDDQRAKLHRIINECLDWGEFDLRIRGYDNCRINITGGKIERIIGEDDSDEKVLV